MSSCSRCRQAHSTAETNWNGDTIRSLLQRWSIVGGTLRLTHEFAVTIDRDKRIGASRDLTASSAPLLSTWSGDLVAGDEVRPQVIDTKLRARFTLLGGTRGLAGLAIAGLEMAAWDALAIAAGIPLAQCLGGAPRPIRAYNSLGMIRPADVDAGVAETLRLGFSGLKIKIGWPTLAEDLAVVRGMRRALPASCALMVDFNQSLDVVEAIRRCRALDTEGVHWIEEPVRCDDFVSAARVTEAVDTPIQIGENFAGVHDMQLACSAAASDLVMPDVQQIGAVTGWLRAAALAEAMGTPLSSHIIQADICQRLSYSRHIGESRHLFEKFANLDPRGV